MSDCRKIAINGYVTIKNGNKIIVDRGKNAIVRQGMRHFIAMLTAESYFLGGYKSSTNPARIWLAANGSYMRFGKDNSPTTQLMDNLVSSIAVNATALSNFVGGWNQGDGNVGTKYIATWASGILNAELTGEEKLGEVGLYL